MPVKSGIEKELQNIVKALAAINSNLVALANKIETEQKGENDG